MYNQIYASGVVEFVCHFHIQFPQRNPKFSTNYLPYESPFWRENQQSCSSPYNHDKKISLNSSIYGRMYSKSGFKIMFFGGFFNIDQAITSKESPKTCIVEHLQKLPNGGKVLGISSPPYYQNHFQFLQKYLCQWPSYK